MKLQAKLTLNFIALVVISIGVSFFLIHWNVQSTFNRFIEEKQQEWEILQGENGLEIQFKHPGRMNPFMQHPEIPPDRETPEIHFLNGARNSLIWAAMIGAALAIILGYLSSSFLLKRIFRLQSAMHQYMERGTVKAVPHEGVDEVDDLAKIYNLLIEKIQKQEAIRREFFVDMSHELRTPLTSIKGYLEGLLDKVFDQKKEKEIHKKLLNETDRMIRLIREMTTLAKLESEKIIVAKEKVDLKKLTDEVVEMLSTEGESPSPKITVNGRAEAAVDPNKWKQVMINLIENALQYGKKDSPVLIEIETKKRQLIWRIKNKTDLMDQKEIEHFFERFYRADKSRSYDVQKPHLGIGLNIVKKIVEHHGGAIAAGLEGEYLVFEITLSHHSTSS